MSGIINKVKDALHKDKSHDGKLLPHHSLLRY